MNRSRSLDTSPGADRFQFERLREMTPMERAAVLTALTRAVEDLALAGIHQRNAGASDDEARMRLAALRLGPEVVRRAWGWTEDGK